MTRLHVRTISLANANDFVATHHRHHKPVRGHKFSISVVDDLGAVHGVAIVGRPVARHRDNGTTLEVTRLCTDGSPNACSMLYSAAYRAAKALGYTRIGTYILDSESGASLRASGWHFVHDTTGGSWNSSSRPRTDKAPTTPKQLWEVDIITQTVGKK